MDISEEHVASIFRVEEYTKEGTSVKHAAGNGFEVEVLPRMTWSPYK
jgi:hypothetical protein